MSEEAKPRRPDVCMYIRTMGKSSNDELARSDPGAWPEERRHDRVEYQGSIDDRLEKSAR